MKSVTLFSKRKILLRFTSTATPSASTPFTVFTMFLVSTTSVRFPFSSILQIPRITPPLSESVFFSTKPAMQDLPPCTRYLLWLMNWDTHCLTGSMPAPAKHFKTPIFIVWTTPRQKNEQISLLPNCFCRTMLFLNRLAITN